MSANRLLVQEQDRILACVHCGFCLNACPTYTRLGDEADSPRGRIYLMRAVAEGRLDPGAEAFRTHIERCVGCRACEPVCPSGVQYGFLLERARATYAAVSSTGASTRMLLRILASPTLMTIALAMSRFLRATRIPELLARVVPARFRRVRLALAMLAASRGWPGLQDAGRRAGAGPRAAAAHGSASAPGPEDVEGATAGQNRELAEPHAHVAGLRAGTAALAQEAPEPATPTPRVATLEGCVQRGLFARVNAATDRVLRANGCDIVAAAGQRCCGALHAHTGDLDTALRLARANIEAFEASGAEYIIVNAAGCGAFMKEYGEQLEHDVLMNDRAAVFSARVRDLSEFLAAKGVHRGGELRLRVTYDAPCHLIHAQRITHAPLQMLEAVPGLEIVPLPGSEECCGGAGTYGLQHPQLGGRILNDKLDAIRTTGAQAVVTPNPGCMMQIGAGLLLRGEEVAVLHPIEVLDESYRRTDPYPKTGNR
jgi:glycolate oxidase iron-sulfur subunit